MSVDVPPKSKNLQTEKGFYDYLKNFWVSLKNLYIRGVWDKTILKYKNWNMKYYIVEIEGESKKIINEIWYKKLKDSLSRPFVIVNEDIFDKFLLKKVKAIDYNIEEALINLTEYWKRTFKADLLNYTWELNEKTIWNMIEKAKNL